MKEMNAYEKALLHEVAELDALPVGAYNIRANGASAARNTTAHIDIVTKTDKPGIDILIKPGTVNESVHIPVIISHQERILNMADKILYIKDGALAAYGAKDQILPQLLQNQENSPCKVLTDKLADGKKEVPAV